MGWLPYADIHKLSYQQIKRATAELKPQIDGCRWRTSIGVKAQSIFIFLFKLILKIGKKNPKPQYVSTPLDASRQKLCVVPKVLHRCRVEGQYIRDLIW